MEEPVTLDEVIMDWASKQSSRTYFKAGRAPQTLQDMIMLALGAMPPPMAMAHALRRCGFTRYNPHKGKRTNSTYAWIAPEVVDREGLLRSFAGFKCVKCGTITRDNRPDGYRFRCVDCGHTETAEQSLARLRTPEQ